MPLQAVQERRTTRYGEPRSTPPPEDLLKHLIGQLRAALRERPTASPHYTPQPGDRVIFDASIDGAHYYIICSKPAPPQTATHLSPRELMIARLIAKGLPNKNISDLLEISPYTVATHLRRIFVKLGVSSRAAMVARLSEENLLGL